MIISSSRKSLTNPTVFTSTSALLVIMAVTFSNLSTVVGASCSSLFAVPHNTNNCPSLVMEKILSLKRSNHLGVARRSVSLYAINNIRGGGYDDDDDDDTDLYDESESDVDNHDDEEEKEDEDEDKEEDEDLENEEATDSSNISSFSTEPVKIILKTNLCLNSNSRKKHHHDNHVIDQSIEITASQSRNIESLKQSVSRQFKSRPPIDSIVLRNEDGLILQNDETVQQLLEKALLHDDEDEDDDDNDDDEGDENIQKTNENQDEDDDDDDLLKIHIHVDIIPPVDPKFGTEIKQQLEKMSNEQILDAYVANLASMHQNSQDLFFSQTQQQYNDGHDDDDDDDNDDIEERFTSISSSTCATMRKHALKIKDEMLNTLTEDQKQILFQTSSSKDGNSELMGGDVSLQQSLQQKLKMKKQRGGATMNMKRALQKNLNINWPDTIRNFFLFLFFGYFGGRNAHSRTIMLLGAPACFIIQARPVKILMKQLFYTLGKPPGIILSLLPAPQQAIMSCDYNALMKELYGDDVGLLNQLIDDGRDSTSDVDGYPGDDSDGDEDEDYSSDEYDDDE